MAVGGQYESPGVALLESVRYQREDSHKSSVRLAANSHGSPVLSSWNLRVEEITPHVHL